MTYTGQEWYNHELILEDINGQILDLKEHITKLEKRNEELKEHITHLYAADSNVRDEMHVVRTRLIEHAREINSINIRVVRMK